MTMYYDLYWGIDDIDPYDEWQVEKVLAALHLKFVEISDSEPDPYNERAYARWENKFFDIEELLRKALELSEAEDDVVIRNLYDDLVSSINVFQDDWGGLKKIKITDWEEYFE